MTAEPRRLTNNRNIAELFAVFLFDAIIAAGGNRSTAHKCAAVWWEATENGDFDLREASDGR